MMWRHDNEGKALLIDRAAAADVPRDAGVSDEITRPLAAVMARGGGRNPEEGCGDTEALRTGSRGGGRAVMPPPSSLVLCLGR